MNNSELSYKLKYILKELGLNKKELLEECKKYNPSLSKPTLLNAINGKNKNTPSIDTLSAIINVCKMSGNPKLKCISFDFLLNDNIKEINAKNISIYQEIGLSDDVISKLKQLNHPIYYDYCNIINYFFIYTPIKYWKYLGMLQITNNIKKYVKIKNQEEILKQFYNDEYLEYIERNFKNIYDIYLILKSNKEIDWKQLDSLLEILINHLQFKLFEINKNLYEDIGIIK